MADFGIRVRPNQKSCFEAKLYMIQISALKREFLKKLTKKYGFPQPGDVAVSCNSASKAVCVCRLSPALDGLLMCKSVIHAGSCDVASCGPFKTVYHNCVHHLNGLCLVTSYMYERCDRRSNVMSAGENQHGHGYGSRGLSVTSTELVRQHAHFFQSLSHD
ncbi:hypothetical protein RF11_09037 [Thelohanellus kitauei]|uniref:Uncharacterized protein n=1 Tax=Thelohanellus kitauei TaxID=669202 RepID=A0A0C2JMW3_THEKT|nr:hypothetical protein RF11_09037 [Thelohanellus kitauei]